MKSVCKVEELRRMKFSSDSKPGWNVLNHQDGAKLSTSFGRAGAITSTTLPSSQFELLLGCTSPQNLTARARDCGIKDPVVLANLSQFYLGKSASVGEAETVASPLKPQVYTPSYQLDDLVQVRARAYGDPIVGNTSYAVDGRSLETAVEVIQQRVTNVRNTTVPPPPVASLMAKFIKLVVPVPHKGVPLSVDDVFERLDKPKQQKACEGIADSMDIRPRELIEGFVKVEACNKVPRLISSFPDFRFIAQLSRFTLAFRDGVLDGEHNSHWFMPGRTPVEIANKLQEFVGKFQGSPIETDFSNFDGTISEWLQKNVAFAAMLRFFDPQFHEELKALLVVLIKCRARIAGHHFYYDAASGVKSGSPTTCDVNTLIDAAVEFVALNLMYPTLTLEEVFERLGLKFGDDGVSRAGLGPHLLKVSRQLGLRLKVVEYDEEAGLTFLGRVYPDIWLTTTSMQDPLRTLRKLHFTHRDPNVPLPDAAIDRVGGYLVTDAHTPIISNYCRLVVRYYESEASSVQERANRKDCLREGPYWAAYGSWPQDPNDQHLLRTCMAYRLGISLEKLIDTENILDRYTAPFGFPVLCEEVEYSDPDSIQSDGFLKSIDQRLLDHRKTQVDNAIRGEMHSSPDRPADPVADPSRSTDPSGNSRNRGPRPNTLDGGERGQIGNRKSRRRRQSARSGSEVASHEDGSDLRHFPGESHGAGGHNLGTTQGDGCGITPPDEGHPGQNSQASGRGRTNGRARGSFRKRRGYYQPRRHGEDRPVNGRGDTKLEP